MTWLSGQGEQDYWLWMEHREGEEEGDITGLEFDYWSNSTSGFGEGDVLVKCGRLSSNVVDDDQTKSCHSCLQTMSWSPSGHYCGNQDCREFHDDGTTC